MTSGWWRRMARRLGMFLDNYGKMDGPSLRNEHLWSPLIVFLSSIYLSPSVLGLWQPTTHGLPSSPIFSES